MTWCHFFDKAVDAKEAVDFHVGVDRPHCDMVPGLVLEAGPLDVKLEAQIVAI
jgi:hypothetical protein